MAKKLLPPIKLDGYDIDISHAPPPQWLPPNVTITAVDSYTTKPPDHLLQSYHIVRVANIASSIIDNDPSPVIKNVMQMLRPGGYIQWHEPDTAHRRIVKSDAALPSPHLMDLLKYVEDREYELGPRGWVDSLPDILTRWGLEVPVGGHRYWLPDKYVKVETDRFLLEVEEVAGKKDKRVQGSGGELRALVRKAGEECARNGQGVRCDMVVVIGRKEGGEW
ncbi:MAG: hypothetical protein Q9170_003421 [Blastenia crenularia]